MAGKKERAEDLRLMSKDFLTEFLAIYREEECLWQTKNKNYSDRNMRAKSYQRLVQKMREADKSADESYVKRKINALRTNYRAELVKLEQSIEFGEIPVYKPRLWYFDLLKFLHERPKEEISSNTFTNGFKDEKDDDCSLLESVDCNETLPVRTVIEVLPPPQTSQTPLPSRKRRQLRSGDILEKLSDILDRCEQDESDLVGKNVASKLRRLPPDMRIYAEKLLNDVLFEAQLGTLSRNSCVVTQYNLD